MQVIEHHHLTIKSMQPNHARTASAAEPLQRAPPAEEYEAAAASEASHGADSALQKAGSADMDSIATLQRIAEALGEVDRDELSEAGLLDVRFVPLAPQNCQSLQAVLGI